MTSSAPLGRRIADRFDLHSIAGRGGMGIVYRATDVSSGAPVALKMMSSSMGDGHRFLREARILEKLDHPHLVRHIAHGRTDEGELYLALEWLEGQPLSHRLASGQLSVGDTLRIGADLCLALAEIHERGIIHRDVKPSNLFLVDDAVDKLKLLDFGIARDHLASTQTTQSGALLGSVGYVAPEQARDATGVTLRSDLFALGCVLYECLTGVPPYSGGGSAAILAKLLLENIPPITALRPDAPDELADLLIELLAKAPHERPASAQAVHGRLEKIRCSAPTTDQGTLPAIPVRMREERLTTVLLFGPAEGHRSAGTDADTVVLADGPQGLDAILSRHGATLTPLLGGLSVVTFEGGSGPIDRACRSAAVALDLSAGQAERPDGPIVLATGRTDSLAGRSFGHAIDRAMAAIEADLADGVYADATTAELLRGRFELREYPTNPLEAAVDFALFVVESPVATRPASVLPPSDGWATPFVGRTKELGLIDATLDEVCDEQVTQVLMFFGPAGIGKSRLAAEAHKRLSSRGTRWISARMDPMAQDSAGSLLALLIRDAADLDSIAPSDRFAALRSHLASRSISDSQHVGDPQRVAEILGELAGVPSTGPLNPALRAAQADPNTMQFWTAVAIPQWLRAEAERSGLVLSIDDFQWADAASLNILARALRDIDETKILVLGFAREINAHSTERWGQNAVQELSLAPLSARAAEAMVRAVATEVDDATAAQVVSRADGNPFYIEELLRGIELGLDGLSASASALIEERIERVDPAARRALRAASVFGEHAPVAGIARLVGDIEGGATEKAVAELLRAKLLVKHIPRHDGRTWDREVGFQHALVRQTAYEMLPADDRRGGHGQVALWLESHGEDDVGLLAEHWSRAGIASKAAHYLAKASERALARGDSRLAVDLATRGLTHEPHGLDRARLLHTEAYALGFAGEFASASVKIREALDLSERGSRLWYSALSGLIYNCAVTSDLLGFRQAVQVLGDVREAIEPSAQSSFALYLIASACYQMDGASAGEPYVQALEQMIERAGDDAQVRGWVMHGRARRAWQRARPSERWKFHEAGLASFTTAGDPLGMSILAGSTAYSSATLGLEPRCRALCARARAFAERGGLALGLEFARLAEVMLDLETNPRSVRDPLAELMTAESREIRCLAAILDATASLRLGESHLARERVVLLQQEAIAPTRRAPDAIAGLCALKTGDLDEAARCLDRCSTDDDEGMYWIVKNLVDQLRLGLALSRAHSSLQIAKAVRRRLEDDAEPLTDEERAHFWQKAFQVAELMRLIADAESQGNQSPAHAS